jgi:predicted MFS family arabinose efflux permease
LVKTPVEQSPGANPGDAALKPSDSVAMGVQSARAPRFLLSARGRAFRAFAHREYSLLFTAFCISHTGFWLSHISMQGLMVKLSGNDPRYLGLLFFCLFIPAFVLAPLAGVAADRLDRKRILTCCYLAVGVLTGALAFATAREAVGAAGLLVIATLFGTSFAFSSPASFALAANAVPAADLPSAVSLSSAANNLTRVLGPLIAAPLVASGAFAFGFAGYMGAVLLAALLTLALRISPHTPDSDEPSMLGRLRRGLDHARERRPAIPALLTVATLSLFGVSHATLLPVYAQLALGDENLFAWIVVAAGVGAMAGSLATGYRRSAPTLPTAGLYMLGYGVALGGFAVSRSLPLALLGQLAIGFFYFSVMTRLQTLLQQIVDESKRGRIMSLFQICWAGLVPFGGLGMGFAAGALGVQTTLIGAAAICSAFGATMALRAGRFAA